VVTDAENKEAEDLNALREKIKAEKDAVKRYELEIQALKLERDMALRKAKSADAQIEQKEKDLHDAKMAAIRTKLYIGAGVLVGIAVILAALCVYFRSAHMAYAAVGAAGLAGLVGFAGFLAPWAVEIASVVAVLFISVVCYMLFNRDKALVQLTKGVNALKQHAPQYKGILREHIDEAQDALIDATRKRWKDETV
jgi:hypothetical protein